MRYAACDALAAVLIFLSMVRMKVGSNSSTGSSDDYASIATLAKSLCQGITDLKYSAAKTSTDNHSPPEKVSCYRCQVNVVNLADITFFTLFCHSVCAQWYDVTMTMTSLHCQPQING